MRGVKSSGGAPDQARYCTLRKRSPWMTMIHRVILQESWWRMDLPPGLKSFWKAPYDGRVRSSAVLNMVRRLLRNPTNTSLFRSQCPGRLMGTSFIYLFSKSESTYDESVEKPINTASFSRLTSPMIVDPTAHDKRWKSAEHVTPPVLILHLGCLPGRHPRPRLATIGARTQASRAQVRTVRD